MGRDKDRVVNRGRGTTKIGLEGGVAPIMKSHHPLHPYRYCYRYRYGYLYLYPYPSHTPTHHSRPYEQV